MPFARRQVLSMPQYGYMNKTKLERHGQCLLVPETPPPPADREPEKRPPNSVDASFSASPLGYRSNAMLLRIRRYELIRSLGSS